MELVYHLNLRINEFGDGTYEIEASSKSHAPWPGKVDHFAGHYYTVANWPGHFILAIANSYRGLPAAVEKMTDDILVGDKKFWQGGLDDQVEGELEIYTTDDDDRWDYPTRVVWRGQEVLQSKFGTWVIRSNKVQRVEVSYSCILRVRKQIDRLLGR